MTNPKLIAVFLLVVCSSCVNYLDPLSNQVFKISRLKADDILFSARLRDVEKGYWQIYGTKQETLQISYADSIPLEKWSERMYAGKYKMDGDTVKVEYLLSHYPANISYMLLRGDTFYIKTKKDTALLKLSMRHFTR